MEQKEIDLVNRVYQDATVGMLAIDKVLKKIENETLRKLFIKQYDMYEAVANKCDIAQDEEKTKQFREYIEEQGFEGVKIWVSEFCDSPLMDKVALKTIEYNNLVNILIC